MFCITARVRPWSARASRSSPFRETEIVLLAASCSTDTSEWNSHWSLPLGPSTLTTRPSTATFTPAGTDTGFLPRRDMFACLYLPNLAEHFAAQLPLPRLAIADHAAAGADHGNPQPAQYRLEFDGAAVDPAARLADAAD